MEHSLPAMRRTLAEAARVHFRPERAEAFGRASAACGQVDRLLTMADHCYALPLLASAYRRSGITTPGAPARDVLDAAYYLCAARRASLIGILDRIADALATEEIPFLVLKGGALELMAPGASIARLTADLDILVPQGKMARCEALLESAGFRPRYPSHVGEFRRHSHHAVPYHLASGAGAADGLCSTAVEIHESLLPRVAPASLPVAPFWERSRQVERRGRWFRCPAPEEMVLHTCIHYGLIHPYNTALRRAWDLALLVEFPAGSPTGGAAPIDWRYVEDRARDWGARRVVKQARAELAWLLGSSAAEPGDDEHGARAPESWSLFEAPCTGLAAFRLQQAASDSLARRARGAWHFLFPGPHETAPVRSDEAHWRYLLRRLARFPGSWSAEEAQAMPGERRQRASRS